MTASWYDDIMRISRFNWMRKGRTGKLKNGSSRKQLFPRKDAHKKGI